MVIDIEMCAIPSQMKLQVAVANMVALFLKTMNRT